MKVVITGAAGQISYSLIPFLCEKGVFNSDEKLDLALVEIPGAMGRLEGFVKELEDSAYSTVNSISIFADKRNIYQLLNILKNVEKRINVIKKDVSKNNSCE